MRKRLIATAGLPAEPTDWLDLARLATAEISSEDAAHPIERTLLPGQTGGWRAAQPGQQSIRLIFDQPQAVRRIQLRFEENTVERTQEYVLRWSPDGGATLHDVVRQQWNFNPGGSSTETEVHRVELHGVTMLELQITPDIGDKQRGWATLEQFRVA